MMPTDPNGAAIMQHLDTSDPLIGTQLGSFTIQRRLGEGGMGVVYELLHPGIGKRLALKLLHTEYASKPEIVQRFFDEARSVNLIGHQNIVDIIDFNQLPDGRSYITMEFLEGESLAQHIERRGAFSSRDVPAIALPICSALGAAHEHGIIHRDLKPENIHLVPRDNGWFVKVLDFGIAKLSADLHAAGATTQSGVVMGTPTYMSPEQAMGRTREVDHRTDIYALGVILYQMLTGVVPFDGDSFGDLLLQHLQEQPAPLQAFRAELAYPWNPIVQKALAKEREQRFQSMPELAEAIRSGEVPAGAGASAETITIETRGTDAPTLAQDAPGSVPPGSQPPTMCFPGQPSAATAEIAPPATEYLGLPSRIGHAPAPRGRRTPWIAAAVAAAAAAAAAAALWPRAQAPRASPAPVATPPAATIDARSIAMATPPDAGVAATTPDAQVAVAEVELDAAPPPRTPSRRTRRANRAAAAGTATLRVLARPWATVYVDGRKRGITPLTLELRAGKHRIRVVNRELQRDVSKTVRLRDGQAESMTFAWR